MTAPIVTPHRVAAIRERDRHRMDALDHTGRVLGHAERDPARDPDVRDWDGWRVSVYADTRGAALALLRDACALAAGQPVMHADVPYTEWQER